ncbi:uncharacterized protein K02A2.6-like [Photinus pyralis]|uniref:uncharacterized protein K02A2.6-like n=2 Tax=Photinus pyralis TaxID=7054 RepID=UPI0012670B2D|nr:uncharacterized protein K02A2.6-like [Photinus pyralis]
MVLIGSMHKFDVKSDEWIVYQEQLEQFFEVNNIRDTQTDKKQVAALLSLIGSDTYKVLRDLCTPSLPKSKSYEELCKLLKAHFSPATCLFRERIDFYAAAQEANESLNKWYARIHNLATNCEFGTNLKSVLRDKFVCGLQKGKIRDRLCEEKPGEVTLEKLMEIALSKEATLLAVDKSVNLVKSNPFQLRQKVFQQRQTPSGNSVEKKMGKWKCTACGRLHTGQQQCRYASYKCNSCNKIGHLSKVSIKKRVEDELNTLQREQVITPVETSEWGTPLVPIIKNDGSLKLCGDYRLTVNRYFKQVQYPLPSVESILMELSGGESFTKLDLSYAYNQISVDDESAMILTWTTHKGLFKVNRLPYGITPASSIFQKVLEQLLQGIKNTANFLDDIIVTGATRKEHVENLKAVLKKLNDAGFKLNKTKCAFFQEEVSYLGFTISKYGIKKNLEKQRAIIEAPRPSTITQVKSFAGMVNYYSKFVPKLAILMRPIYDLLKQNQKYKWTSNCEKSFKEIKSIIASDQILAHFDPNLPIVVQTDASQDGIAGALFNKNKNGILKPVAFISRSLMPAEKNYSVLDKESLAIYWSVKKLYQYLMGQQFTIQTDHRPLVSILGETKGIPQMAASRLQRWSAFLSGFSYKLEYIKGENNNVADMLSRHPVDICYISKGQDVKSSHLNMIISENLPVDYKKVALETRKDVVLSKVYNYLSVGWPSKVEEQTLTPYFRKRLELTLEQGCVMWGYRIIIPTKFRQQLLDELHSSHLGIVKMKSIARAYFYWPNLDKDIEETCRACIPCQTIANNPQKSEIMSWNKPTRPWQRIHVDFLGPIKGNTFLIVLDAFSKYPEIKKMERTTSEETIEKFRDIFSTWGIPETIVSDNGPQFVSTEFKNFLIKNGIRQITSAPYHPSTNGAAENAVRTFKKSLKAALLTHKHNITPSLVVSRYLLNYRNSVHCATNETPSKLMIGRNVRTLFNLLQPRRENKENNGTGRHETFQEGETVMVKDYRDKNNTIWIKAKISQVLGKKNYLCMLLNGQTWRRHLDQIRKFGLELNHDIEKTSENHTTKVPSQRLEEKSSTSTPQTEIIDDVQDEQTVADSNITPLVNAHVENVITNNSGNLPETIGSNYSRNNSGTIPEAIVSRSGRKIKKPEIFKDFECT